MSDKKLPKILSVILIAIIAVIFNFSLPKIEDLLTGSKIFSLSSEKTSKFYNGLSVDDKNILSQLPCDGSKSKCADSTFLKQKFDITFTDSSIKRALILSLDGTESFSNRAIDSKYRNLLSEADKKNKIYYVENVSGSSGKDKKLIVVEKLPDSGKFIFTLFNPDKIGFIGYKLVYAAVIFIPTILLLFLLNRKGATITVKEKVNIDNQNYISQIEELKKENVQQSQFLANFTHELRTPLNSIIGFSGLIKDQTLGPLGNSEYVKYATDINTSGVHLLSLINDILDYSKSEVGKLKVNLTEVDIIKIIKQSLSIISPRASESRVDLMQSFANDYFILRVDPKRLKQIMLNLLSNSVKFTPEGGSVMVSVFPDLKGEKVSIEVKDTGVGIAEKDIPTVMSLFGQVETDLNRKYEGTGIGLPFAKKLTAIMGGIFDLQSKVGVGTRITLTFPYDKKLNAEYGELYKKTSTEV